MRLADEVDNITLEDVILTGQMDMLLRAEERRQRMISKGLWKQAEQKVAYGGVSPFACVTNSN